MMHIYIGKAGYPNTPIVIETNIAWAIPYWEKRKQLNPNIRWVFD